MFAMIRVFIAVLALAACQGPGGAVRDDSVMIASSTQFNPARFGDVWHVVAAYGTEARCGPMAETWVPTGPGQFRVTGTACGPSGPRAFVAQARVSGPGRMRIDGPSGGRDLWVLWVDADYRVAVIGSPDGSGGRILGRSPTLRGDLLSGAREVLDFNGYDLTKLQML